VQVTKFIISIVPVLMLTAVSGLALGVEGAVATADNTFNEKLPPAMPPDHDGSHDFDYLHGKWTMQNRRLLKRMANSHDWAEYASTAECQAMPGGIGNQDVYRTEYWPNFVGMTFRIYDPKSRLWSLYWIDNRNDYHGKLEAPVVGSFHGNVGIFEGPDEQNGKPVIVRYTWTVVDGNHAHWEQAFSADGGNTWETNMTNDSTRVPG
jgi:hypothetical protein